MKPLGKGERSNSRDYENCENDNYFILYLILSMNYLHYRRFKAMYSWNCEAPCYYNRTI